MRMSFMLPSKGLEHFKILRMKKRALLRLFTILVFFLFVQIPVFGLQVDQQQSISVEIEKLTVLEGYTVSEGVTIYLLEDEHYLIQAQIVFPQYCPERIKIVSILSGPISIEELGLTSTMEGVFEFDLGNTNRITITLEGKAPKALIAIEGDPAVAQDNMIIIGEKKIRLFEIFIQDTLVEIDDIRLDLFVLTSYDIVDAKSKITEAQKRIQEAKHISNYRNIEHAVVKAESLLAIAEECLQQGAPEQASRIAEESLAYIILVTQERLQMFNHMLQNTNADMSVSARFAHLASEEMSMAEAEETGSKGYILHLGNTEDYLSQAVEAYIHAVDGRVGGYEISKLNLIVIITSITAAILILTLYVRSKRRNSS